MFGPMRVDYTENGVQGYHHNNSGSTIDVPGSRHFKNPQPSHLKDDETCTLTMEQYNQLLQFVSRTPIPPSSGNMVTHSTNLTGSAAGLNVALTVQSLNTYWIVDTGATNHMVADLYTLEHHIVSKTDKPRKVSLPNGDVALVINKGSSTLQNDNIITDVLHIS